VAAQPVTGPVPRPIAEPAAQAVDSDVHLALLAYRGGNCNPRPNGLPRLAWELRKRTSIAIDLEVPSVDPTSEALFNYPLLVWQGDAAFLPLPQAAIVALRHYLSSGGSLLIDESDGGVPFGFDASVRRDMARILEDMPPRIEALAQQNRLVRLPADHVVYRSFYLVDRHGGRLATHPYLEGAFVGNRLAVVLSANDLAGAMARDPYGDWEYDVGQGGAATREMTYRLGINWAMYALCLDYKADQVHLPFILQRRH
jgi:hypothetical protein